MSTFRPMLAATAEPGQPLKHSVLVSAKLDGIRCVIRDGQALSRSLKPIPNKQLREILSHPLLDGLDGELMAGPPNAGTAFNGTVRSVRSHDADPGSIRYWVFDCFDRPSDPFHARLKDAAERVKAAQLEGLPVTLVHHWSVDSESRLQEVYGNFLEQGYEGAMVRDPLGPYKTGRSTLREGYLLKLKPWADSEALVIGYDELERNHNELEISELGYAKRSTSKDGKVSGDTLGALQVRDIYSGVEFSIGGGFTEADRDELWAQRDTLPGRIVRYKSVMVGVMYAPRFPVWLGFRDPDDMEAA